MRTCMGGSVGAGLSVYMVVSVCGCVVISCGECDWCTFVCKCVIVGAYRGVYVALLVVCVCMYVRNVRVGASTSVRIIVFVCWYVHVCKNVCVDGRMGLGLDLG